MNTLRAAGCDAAVWFAPDELMLIEDCARLRCVIERDPFAIYMAETLHTCWWNARYEVPYWPPLTGLPIAYDPFFADVGKADVLDYERHAVAQTTMWHFAFARPDDDMREKFFGRWGHADAGYAEAERHWRMWNEWSLGAKMHWPPSTPTCIEDELPTELRLRLETAGIYSKLRQ